MAARGDRGYTLIEFALVLGIIVMSLSIVGPQLSGFINGWNLQIEARKLQAYISKQQQRSKMSAREYGIQFDVPFDGYYLGENSGSWITDETVWLQNGVTLQAATGIGTPPTLTFDQFGAPTTSSLTQITLQDPDGRQLDIYVYAVTGRIKVDAQNY